MYATRGQDLSATGAGDWWAPAAAGEEPVAEEIEVVDPQPIYANLIEFPRELVATRKVRPRLSESPQAATEAGVQLSIFEVDPGAVATEASVEAAEPSEVAFAGEAFAGQAFAAPRWSGIRLDAHPLIDEEEVLLEEPQPEAGPVVPLEPVAFNRRLMALCVDFALVSGSLLAAATMAASKFQVLPSLRTLEIGAGLAVLVAGAMYHTLIFSLARSTPGMKYARIQLVTFEGLTPKRAQRWGRMLALLVSAVPAGLGIAWALFDDDHLCWHDRLSKTYLRRI